jgi:hypothetical protein
LKAKDLKSALEVNVAGSDKNLIAETSSSASLSDLNAMLNKSQVGKQSTKAPPTVGAFSKASKSTAAMS